MNAEPTQSELVAARAFHEELKQAKGYKPHTESYRDTEIYRRIQASIETDGMEG